jgi:hypothetical protein
VNGGRSSWGFVWDVCKKLLGPRAATSSVYNDPEQQEQFSNHYAPKPQPVETAGVFRSNVVSQGLKQNTNEYLKPHLDSDNDDQPETAASRGNYSPCKGFSTLLYHPKLKIVDWFGFTTYGKRPCQEYMEKRRVFGPAIEAAKANYQETPDLLKKITSELFEDCDLFGRLLPGVHLDKLVYYNNHTSIVLEAKDAFWDWWQNNPAYVVGMVLCSETSNFPPRFLVCT